MQQVKLTGEFCKNKVETLDDCYNCDGRIVVIEGITYCFYCQIKELEDIWQTDDLELNEWLDELVQVVYADEIAAYNKEQKEFYSDLDKKKKLICAHTNTGGFCKRKLCCFCRLPGCSCPCPDSYLVDVCDDYKPMIDGKYWCLTCDRNYLEKTWKTSIYMIREWVLEYAYAHIETPTSIESQCECGIWHETYGGKRKYCRGCESAEVKEYIMGSGYEYSEHELYNSYMV